MVEVAHPCFEHPLTDIRKTQDAVLHRREGHQARDRARVRQTEWYAAPLHASEAAAQIAVLASIPSLIDNKIRVFDPLTRKAVA